MITFCTAYCFRFSEHRSLRRFLLFTLLGQAEACRGLRELAKLFRLTLWLLLPTDSVPTRPLRLDTRHTLLRARLRLTLIARLMIISCFSIGNWNNYMLCTSEFHKNISLIFISSLSFLFINLICIGFARVLYRLEAIDNKRAFNCRFGSRH